MRVLISRRRLLQSAAASAGAFACARHPNSDEKRPHIVLCMGDDHGWHETGFSGHPDLQTPVLDEMADAGLRLDRFYAAAPVCSPTRGSVIIGRHPNRYGTFGANWSVRPEESSVAQILARAGYACGHFGKWHLGPVNAGSPTNPGAMGFDEWLSHDNFFEMDPFFSRNGGPPERYRGESSQIVVDAAIEFMRQTRHQGRPFFVVIWFGSPHEPYSGLEADLDLYASLPASLQESTARITSMESGLQTQVRLDKVLQARFAEITAMDRAMGRLREHLRQRDMRENTLLWYCSDNGAPPESRFASPLRARKGSLYEGGVRVPGIVEWPARIPKSLQTEVNAVTSDIVPTLCDLSGQQLPERPLDGLSLVPLFDGAMQERQQPICFWKYPSNRDKKNEPYIDPQLQAGTTPLVKRMNGRLTRNFRNFHHPIINEQDFAGPRAILASRYKLVVDEERPASSDPEAPPIRELFDIRADSAERNNLAPAQTGISERLAGHLRAWQQSVLESLTGADYA